MNYQNLVNDITQSILESVKKIVSNELNCDKTFKAKIVEIISFEKFRVLHNGQKYTVTSNLDCDVNDLVMVCAPCNNWKNLYVVANITKGKTLKDIYNLLNELQNTISELETQVSNLQQSMNNNVS